MTTTLTSEQVFDEVLIPLVEEVEEEIGEEISRDRDTTLLGEDSALDSLAVVTLLVSVEEEIAARTGQEIRLVDERAMSKKASPFRTLGTLSDHICELL